MSQKSRYHIRCPKCQLEQEVELCESLNVRSTPELKDKLMRNQLNLVQCGGCGASFRVDKPLLYNDPARQVMIYLIPLQGASVEEGCQQFSECLARVNHILPQDI